MPLFDIFSKNKKKGKKKEREIKIIADIHEKNSLVIPSLMELGAEIESKPLEIGDYIVNNIAVERKTAGDFISSMLSRRLFEQLHQIQQYEKRLLIIEGDMFIAGGSKINPNALKGMILSISLDFKTPIIFTKNSEDTAQYLFLLAKQQLKGVQESSLHSRKPASMKEQKEYIIESFPGIGPKTAKELLKKFKTVKNIINSEEKELGDILKSKTKDFRNIIES